MVRRLDSLLNDLIGIKLSIFALAFVMVLWNKRLLCCGGFRSEAKDGIKTSFGKRSSPSMQGV
jgi:hypothetical protein